MGRHTQTITADGDVLLADVVKAAGKDRYFATVSVFGSTFGSGTVTMKYSPDGGTTKLDITDTAGNALTFTANGGRNIELAFGAGSTPLKIYASMGSSTSPNVNVYLDDNAS